MRPNPQEVDNDKKTSSDLNLFEGCAGKTGRGSEYENKARFTFSCKRLRGLGGLILQRIVFS